MNKVTRNWVVVPGLIVTKEQAIGPDEAKALIESMGLKCNICLEDVFSFFGDETITVVFINRLEPLQAVLVIPETEFRKAMNQ